MRAFLILQDTFWWIGSITCYWKGKSIRGIYACFSKRSLRNCLFIFSASALDFMRTYPYFLFVKDVWESVQPKRPASRHPVRFEKLNKCLIHRVICTIQSRLWGLCLWWSTEWWNTEWTQVGLPGAIGMRKESMFGDSLFCHRLVGGMFLSLTPSHSHLIAPLSFLKESLELHAWP